MNDLFKRILSVEQFKKEMNTQLLHLTCKEEKDSIGTGKNDTGEIVCFVSSSIKHPNDIREPVIGHLYNILFIYLIRKRVKVSLN